MSRFTRKISIAVLKTMEALGTSAANLASNAKLKVNELTLETRRREILTDFSLQAFELWQKGVTLPDPLAGMLTELSDIESRLSVLRAQKYAKLNADGAAKGRAKGDAQAADEAPTLDTENVAPSAEQEGDALDAATEVADAATALTDAGDALQLPPQSDTPREEQ